MVPMGRNASLPKRPARTVRLRTFVKKHPMRSFGMTSRFTELIVDCTDLDKMASFWCAVLGYRILEKEDDLIEIGAAELAVEHVREAPPVPTIVFVTVPERKTVKNRIHIDVSPVDATQEEEVDRLLALGATRADVGQGERSWVVLADPEGNEFCVLRSLKPSS